MVLDVSTHNDEFQPTQLSNVSSPLSEFNNTALAQTPYESNGSFPQNILPLTIESNGSLSARESNTCKSDVLSNGLKMMIRCCKFLMV